VKHRGPGASLSPAREAALATSRAAGRPRPATPRAGAQGVQVGDWLLHQDPVTGGLAALHGPTGHIQVLLLPPEPEPLPDKGRW